MELRLKDRIGRTIASSLSAEEQPITFQQTGGGEIHRNLHNPKRPLEEKRRWPTLHS